MLEVRPVGAETWIGMFADGRLFPGDGSSYALALPDQESMAVVCNGAGYRVSAHDPGDWTAISPVVVREPMVLPALELVLFVGFTDLTAWGPNGRAWDTQDGGQLVSDDLEVMSVAGHVLHVQGSSPPGTTRRFSVDLRTGASQQLSA